MVIALMLACLALAPRQDPLAEVPVLETKHYQLVFDMSAERRTDWSALTEAAWRAYRQELGAKPRTKPGKRPCVRFYASRADWLAGMQREQVFPLPGVRFVHFAPERDTLYLHKEINAYHTRKMLLYGLFLQFHFHLKSKNQYLGKEWFITGMADALSTHRWDGEQLELGAQLWLKSDNRARLAIERGVLDKLGDGELSVEDMSDWDVRWALTAFLLFGEEGAYRKVFQKLALGKQGSMLLGTDFLSGIGDTTLITAQMDAWVRASSLSFAPMYGTWEEHGNALWGAPPPGLGDGLALALADESVGAIQVELTSAITSGSGLVLEWRGPNDFTYALLRDDTLLVRHWTSQGVEGVDEHSFPGSDGRPIQLRAELGKDEVVLLAGTHELGRYAVSRHRLGLIVESRRAGFTGLVVE